MKAEVVMRVRWEIDVTAETAAEAAMRALEIMRDPESLGLVFDVDTGAHQNKRTWTRIDLEESAVCDNCGNIIKLGEQTFRFAEIRDFFQRVEPGGMVPSCECPKCGALAYPAAKMLHKRKE